MTVLRITCPYCPRQFGSPEALTQHMRAKRRVSATHGLSDDGERFPRSRRMIADAIIDKAILNAFEKPTS